MSATKVAISLDDVLLQRLDTLVKTQAFQSRDHAIQEAITEKINRLNKTALARECAKLDANEEQKMADRALS